MKLIKNIFLIFIITASCIFVTSYINNMMFVQKKTGLEDKISELEDYTKRYKQDIEGLKEDKDSLTKDNERLQKDILFYLKQQQEVADSLKNTQKMLLDITNEKNEIQDKLTKSEKTAELLKKQTAGLQKSRQKLMNETKTQTHKNLKTVELEKEVLQKKLDSAKSDSYYKLGVAYAQNNDYSHAIEMFNKSISLNPNDFSSHYNLAIIYDDCLSDKEKAVFHYKEYLKQEPRPVDSYQIEDWIKNLEAELSKNTVKSVK